MNILTNEEKRLVSNSAFSKENIAMLLICIISSLAIYSSTTTLSEVTTQRALVAVVYISTLIVAFKIITSAAFKWSAVLISPLLYVFICYFKSSEGSFNALLLLELLLFTSMSSDSKLCIYILFKKYMLITGVLGILGFICFSSGLPLPYDVVAYYGENTSTVYVNYHFTYFVFASPFVRLCGLFNEPGFYGTIAAFVLCIDRMNLKKWDNLLIFIAGCLTFSMAYFAIIFIYLVFLTRKRKGVFFVLIALYVFVLFVLPELDLGPSVNKLISRFTIEDGQFVGDNRSDEALDDALEVMMNSQEKWLGYGQGYASTLATGISTYKIYLINYGIFGFILIFGSLVLSTFRLSQKNAYIVIFLICFYVSVYQRPNIYTVLYFVVLLGGIEYIKATTEPNINSIEQ